MALLVLQPLLLFCFVATLFVLGRWPGAWKVQPRRVRVAVAMGCVTFLALLLGGVEALQMPVREVSRVFETAELGGAVLVSVYDLVRNRFLDWMLAAAPFSIAAGVSLGAFASAWRHRHAPVWRHQKVETRHKLAAGKERRARSKAAALHTRLSDGQRWQSARVVLGIEPSGAPAVLSGAAVAQHALFVGPTGTGKTTTISRLLETCIVDWQVSKWAVVVMDFKGSPELARATEAMAVATKRTYQRVDLYGRSASYNPLQRGTPAEIEGRITQTLANSDDGGFSEPYYFNLGQRWLMASCWVLCDLADRGVQRPRSTAVWRRTLSDLADIMHPDMMKLVTPDARGEAKRRAEALEQWTAKEVQDAGSFRSRIAVWVEASAGRITSYAPGEAIDLERTVKTGGIVHFCLDAQSDPTGATTLGNLLLGDLGDLFGQLNREGWASSGSQRCVVVCEEFGALGGSQLTGLYERSRSGGGTLWLSCQTDGTLDEVGPAFKQKVFANSGLWVMHAQPDAVSAESIASSIGTQSGFTETMQIEDDVDLFGSRAQGSGVGSLRETESFIVHPNELKSLGRGEVVIVSRIPQREVIRCSVSLGQNDWEKGPSAPTTSVDLRTPEEPPPVATAELSYPDEWAEADEGDDDDSRPVSHHHA